MNVSRGLWKTGVMAAVATLIFSAFIYRAGDWAKGLNSEFVVYGQTGGPGGGTSGGTGTTATAVTKIIPHIAIGSYDGNLTKYVTAIQILNAGSTAVTVSASFFNETNGAASTTSMNQSLGGAASTAFTGSLTNVSIPANQVLLITAGDGAKAPTYVGVWGKITATAAVSINTVFDYREVDNNALFGRVGVSSSDQDMKSFVIPRLRNAATTLDTGFAIVNTGTTTANLTATLYGANGTIISTKTQAFPAGQATVTFAQQFFNLTESANITNYQSIVFTSTSSQFAAVALGQEGASLASFPVDRLQ